MGNGFDELKLRSAIADMAKGNPTGADAALKEAIKTGQTRGNYGLTTEQTQAAAREFVDNLDYVQRTTRYADKSGLGAQMFEFDRTMGRTLLQNQGNPEALREKITTLQAIATGNFDALDPKAYAKVQEFRGKGILAGEMADMAGDFLGDLNADVYRAAGLSKPNVTAGITDI